MGILVCSFAQRLTAFLLAPNAILAILFAILAVLLRWWAWLVLCVCNLILFILIPFTGGFTAYYDMTFPRFEIAKTINRAVNMTLYYAEDED